MQGSTGIHEILGILNKIVVLSKHYGLKTITDILLWTMLS